MRKKKIFFEDHKIPKLLLITLAMVVFVFQIFTLCAKPINAELIKQVETAKILAGYGTTTIGGKTYYIIDSKNALKQLSTDSQTQTFSGKSFIQTADIDFGGDSFTPIGKSGSRFQGIYDGNGHTISNFEIDGSGGGQDVGLFSYTDGAEIKNITINKPTIISASDKAKDVNNDGFSAGTVVGTARNSSKISNCLVFSGDIEGPSSDTDLYIGGIVGYAYGSVKIENCYFQGWAGNYSKSKAYTGGMLGWGSDIQITGCWNAGAVRSGKDNTVAAYAGGILGYSTSGTVSNCLNSGEIDSYAKERSYNAASSSRLSVHSSAGSNGPAKLSTSGNKTGEIEKPAYTGGICGYFSGKLEYVYNQYDDSFIDGGYLYYTYTFNIYTNMFSYDYSHAELGLAGFFNYVVYFEKFNYSLTISTMAKHYVGAIYGGGSPTVSYAYTLSNGCWAPVFHTEINYKIQSTGHYTHSISTICFYGEQPKTSESLGTADTSYTYSDVDSLDINNFISTLNVKYPKASTFPRFYLNIDLKLVVSENEDQPLKKSMYIKIYGSARHPYDGLYSYGYNVYSFTPTSLMNSVGTVLTSGTGSLSTAIWTTTSGINGGQAYLKHFYWIKNTEKPGS